MWIAFTIGFLGSLHCVGMCGPIALSLPGQFTTTTGFVISRLLYNGGRIVSYALIGLVIGLLSNGVAMFAYQQTLSMITGVLILLWAITRIPAVSRRIPEQVFFWNKPLNKAFGKLFKRHNTMSLGLIGVLNGFLPCGLVYLAAFASVEAGSWAYSMAFMAFFGLGTVPMMLSLTLSKILVKPARRLNLNRAIPYIAMVMAVVFILRGAGLGIPLLSPPAVEHDAKTGAVRNECCEGH